jgi:Cobalamin adenosyltransferase
MRVLVRLLLDARAGTAQLETIQSRLLDVGSAVATPIEATGPGTATKQQRVQFDAAAASALETWIDEMDQELPQLTNFILPSGTHWCCWRVQLDICDDATALTSVLWQILLMFVHCDSRMQAGMRHRLCTWPARSADEQSEQLCRWCSRGQSAAMLAST